MAAEGPPSLRAKQKSIRGCTEGLFRVADERIDAQRNCAKRTTIITTNNTQKQLEMMYNPKLISRLLPKAEEQRIKFNGMGDVRRV